MLRALLGLCPLLVAGPLLAAEPAPADPVAAEARDPHELEEALDALIPGRLEALGVPGVAVAVVRRDGVLPPASTRATSATRRRGPGT